jgi:hypothetical protein
MLRSLICSNEHRLACFQSQRVHPVDAEQIGRSPDTSDITSSRERIDRYLPPSEDASRQRLVLADSTPLANTPVEPRR